MLNRTRLTPRMLRFAHLSDYAGLALRPPRGTRTQSVPFARFAAELVRGPRVYASGRVILYFHGGCFFCGGLRTYRQLVARVSVAVDGPVLSVAYRKLPAVGLGTSVEDCLEAYRMLLDRGFGADQVVFAGDSAGGCLAFATALAAAHEDLPVPAGIAVMSPWVDLECLYSADHPNASSDPYLPVQLLWKVARLLSADHSPFLRLLEADLAALPPTLIQVGSLEVLRSDAELMSERLARASVGVRLQIWQDQVHVFQLFADVVAEGRRAIEEIGAFVRAVTDGTRAHA
ncbi:alpha/beta hydrolase [Streptomyces sp. NBC_01304]|uniref:alpha/beta hydrolase n=1 Tax=Streptomyces sp. NBC_01304 TaxID=2903818 RepID=UPI002E158659|nr:alpha/beta hydrolase [Streptomyces sp. NBC_01304]